MTDAEKLTALEEYLMQILENDSETPDRLNMADYILSVVLQT